MMTHQEQLTDITQKFAVMVNKSVCFKDAQWDTIEDMPTDFPYWELYHANKRLFDLYNYYNLLCLSEDPKVIVYTCLRYIAKTCWFAPACGCERCK